MVFAVTARKLDALGPFKTLKKRTEVLGGYDAAQYASERVFATAHDGVRMARW